MKPNIVFFGEDLGDTFHTQMGDDHDKLDLLVVIGSSMQVRPVSLIPYNISPDVPQILINREPLPKYQADIKLLGNCDLIISLLALSLGGTFRMKMLEGLFPILHFFSNLYFQNYNPENNKSFCP